MTSRTVLAIWRHTSAKASGGWPNTIQTDGFDTAVNPWVPAKANTKAELAELLNRNAAAAVDALKNCPADLDWNTPWVMRNGEQIFMSLPRIITLRSMVMNHLVHHRGQLTVYLRLHNTHVPGAYGPSADDKEKWAQPA